MLDKKSDEAGVVAAGERVVTGELVARPPLVEGGVVVGLDDLDALPVGDAARVAHELPRHPVSYLLLGLASGSRPTMLGALHALARIASRERLGAWSLPWWELTAAETQRLRAVVVERYQPATAKKIMVALRQVLRACERLELMSPEALARALRFDKVKGESEPTGRSLTTDELRALLYACEADPSPLGVRDAALIGLAVDTGARAASIVGLDVHDVEKTRPDEWTVRFRVVKGNKSLTGYVGGRGLELLRRWLALRGDEPGAIFCPLRKGGRIVVGRRLSYDQVLEAIRRRAIEARIGEVSTHDLRKTFGSMLLEQGVDLSTVQQLLGHANPGTTSRYYDKRGPEARRRAARMMRAAIDD